MQLVKPEMFDRGLPGDLDQIEPTGMQPLTVPMRPSVSFGIVSHPLLEAVAPLIDALGCEIVSSDDAVDGDVALEWEGSIVAIVRLPDLNGALGRQVALVEAELGGSLSSLSFDGKHRAVRLLEERGAFTVRKGVEQVADTLGVSRFTIYNYLNATRTEDGGSAVAEEA